MGGTYEPSNVILLTIKQHSLAHKKLYEKHGKIADFIAWKMLSGQMGKQEAIKAAQKLPKTQAHKDKIRDACIANKSHIWLLEWQKNPKKKQKVYEKVSKSLTGKKKSKSHVENMKKRPQDCITLICPHCGKVGDYKNMKRWHMDNCKTQSHKFR